jgi:hypothetical protein
MTSPGEVVAGSLTVAAIYALTGWALGVRRRQDPVLWIATSMAAVLMVGEATAPAFGDPVELWNAVLGVLLGAWAWRRWYRGQGPQQGSQQAG